MGKSVSVDSWCECISWVVRHSLSVLAIDFFGVGWSKFPESAHSVLWHWGKKEVMTQTFLCHHHIQDLQQWIVYRECLNLDCFSFSSNYSFWLLVCHPCVWPAAWQWECIWTGIVHWLCSAIEQLMSSAVLEVKILPILPGTLFNITNICLPAAAIIWWESVWLKFNQCSRPSCWWRVLQWSGRQTKRGSCQQEPIRQHWLHWRVWTVCSDR